MSGGLMTGGRMSGGLMSAHLKFAMLHVIKFLCILWVLSPLFGDMSHLVNSKHELHQSNETFK